MPGLFSVVGIINFTTITRVEVLIEIFQVQRRWHWKKNIEGVIESVFNKKNINVSGVLPKKKPQWFTLLG